MIENKMAGFLAMLAFVVLAGTWLLRMSFRLPVMDIKYLCGYGVVVIIFIFIYGLMIAKVGVALIHEVLDEQRTKEEEERYRAKLRYSTPADQALAAEDGAADSGITILGEEEATEA